MRQMKLPSARFYDYGGYRWPTISSSFPGTDRLVTFEPEQLIIAFTFILKGVLGLGSKLRGHRCNRCNRTVIYTVP